MSLPTAARWWLLALALTGAAPVARAQEGVPPQLGIASDVERVLYIPMPEGTSPRMKRQEVPLIARYFRSAGLADTIDPVPAQDQIVFQAVEAGLVMDAREVRCADIEGGQVIGQIESARKAVAEGDYAAASQALEKARHGLPCATRKIGRRQLGEFFLFTGLVALQQGVKGEGEVWIRSALAVDADLKTSPIIPDRYVGELERLAFEVESVEKVDTRLSPDQGELWLPRNLVIDGRRMIFDRMFIEMVPGYHYIQLTLPDETSWGALLFVEGGQIYDLIEGVRSSLNLRELFDTQMILAIRDGVLEPALAQGLRYYARLLKKDSIYLAQIREQAEEVEGDAATASRNQAVLVVRRFDADGKLVVPDAVLKDQVAEGTSAVAVQFVPPWGIDLVIGSAQIQNGELAYKSNGLNLEVNVRYLASQQFYVGAALAGGVRFSAEVNGLEVSNLSTDPDLSATGYVGLDLPAGPLSVRTDLGYIRHLTPLTNLPFLCALGSGSGSGYVYSCSDDPAEIADVSGAQDVIPFNFSGTGGGPRIRLALVFSPFVRDVIQLQGLIRASYTPLVVNLEESGSATVDNVPVQYEFLSGSNTQLFHRLDVAFGVSGTF